MGVLCRSMFAAMLSLISGAAPALSSAGLQADREPATEVVVSAALDARDSMIALLNSYKDVAPVAVEATVHRLASQKLPLEGKFILVNIASQTLTAYQDGEPVIQSRVIVGTPRTKTPTMVTEAVWADINPSWYVPVSIMRRKGWDQKLQTDTDYFKRQGFSIGDGRLVQRPGDHNALGRVKIGLRDGGAIYLHGTNEPEKFKNEKRALSSGCVRVEKIRELTAWIFDMSIDEVDDRIEAKRTQRVKPTDPVPVVIGYYTAWVDDQNKLVLFDDVYRRDASGR